MDFTADTGISPGRLDDGILEGCDFFGKCRLVLDCDSCGFCSDPQNQESGIDSRFFSGCGSVDY